HMLVLPTGQILMSDGIGKDLFLYTHTADGTDLDPTSLKPGIKNIVQQTLAIFNQFTLTGFRLNGVTEGAYYGDDASMSTNYPLIRFTKVGAPNDGNVYYGISSGWSKT